MADKLRDPTTSFGNALSRPRPDLENSRSGTDLADNGKRRFRDAFLLRTDRIRANSEQVRQEGKGPDDPETIALSESIREQGLQHLIVVRHLQPDDIYEVVSGERRFIAMTDILNWEEIPVRLLDVPEADVMWVQLHENLLRKSLSPRDLAAAILKAKLEGMSLKQIAEKMKRSETWVQKALTIAEKLTDEARQELQRGSQGESLEVMYSVATAPQAVQEMIAREIVEGNLSKRDAQSLIAKQKKERSDNPGRGRPAKSRPFQQTFRAPGGFSVSISARRSEVGHVELLEALEHVLNIVREEASDE